jgi:ubiquinone/menaquinone biosynthesis C-methylase UbiE
MSDKVSTVRKCKNIRDQIYDCEDLPDSIFRKEILKLVSPKSTIVDIGCGREATFLRSISSYAEEVYGVDLEIVEKIVDGNIQIINGDAEAIPLPDRIADVITMINVAEHLPDPKRVFMECKRVLKPGGSLVLTAPSKFHPPILVSRAFSHRIRQWINYVITGTQSQDTFPAYYKADSARVLRKLVSSVGLRMVSIKYLSNHPQYFMFSTLVYRCAVAIERHVFQQEAFQCLRQQIFCHCISPAETD